MASPGAYLGGPLYRHGPVKVVMHGMGFDQDPRVPTDPGPHVKPPGMDADLEGAYSRMCHRV